MSNSEKKSNDSKVSFEKREGNSCGYRLLERKAEQLYIDEWTSLLAKPISPVHDFKFKPLVIFRVFQELLALSTEVFVEIADKKSIHTIPGKSNDILLGVLNLRGQLRLCIALHNFLKIVPSQEEEILNTHQMILAIQKDGDFWTLPVHQVFGIYYCPPQDIRNIPVTVAKSTANYLQGIINWEGKNVGYLDDELLFFSLKRKVL